MFTGGRPSIPLKRFGFTRLLADVGEDAAVHIQHMAVDRLKRRWQGTPPGPQGPPVVPQSAAAGVFAMMNWSNGWRLPVRLAFRSKPSAASRCILARCRCTGCCIQAVFRWQCSSSASSGRPLRRRIRAHRLAPQLAHHAADVDDPSVSLSIIPGITALSTMNGAFRSTSTTCRNWAAVISHMDAL